MFFIHLIDFESSALNLFLSLVSEYFYYLGPFYLVVIGTLDSIMSFAASSIYWLKLGYWFIIFHPFEEENFYGVKGKIFKSLLILSEIAVVVAKLYQDTQN